MKKFLSKTILASALITSANAGAILDVEFGGGMWAAGKPTGQITSSGTVVDLANEAKLESSNNMYAWAVIDHPIPVIPNIRVEHTALKTSGTNSAGLTVGSFSVNNSVNTELDLTHTDFIGYWGIPFGTWLPFIDELDFGLGAKVFTGSLTAADTLGVVTPYDKAFNAAVPYGYGKLRIAPPLMMGAGIEGEVKYLTIDVGSLKTNFIEYIIKADWGITLPIPALDIKPGIEVGYRNMSLDVDAGSTANADIGFSGIFFGAYAKFGL